MRHECNRHGTESKCHICEDIACGNADEDPSTCAFQLQGVKWEHMSTNIPTVSDTPWAVGGRHRNDFGRTEHIDGSGRNTHTCLMINSGHCINPDPSEDVADFSDCTVRCWGYDEYSSSGEFEGQVPKEHKSDPEGTLDGHKYILGVSATRPEGAHYLAEDEHHPVYTAGLPQPNYRTDSWEYLRRERKQGYVATLAGNGERGFQDGDASDARFDKPQDVCVDNKRNVYVADSGNHRVRRIDAAAPAHAVTTYAGSGTAGHKDGLLAEAEFSSPSGVALWYDWPSRTSSSAEDREVEWVDGVDPLLVIYVADTGNHRIRKIQGGKVTLADVAAQWIETLDGGAK